MLTGLLNFGLYQDRQLAKRRVENNSRLKAMSFEQAATTINPRFSDRDDRSFDVSNYEREFTIRNGALTNE